MIASSRPLRFLLLVIGGWIAVRATVYWPTARIVPDLVPNLVAAVAPPAAAARQGSRVREAAAMAIVGAAGAGPAPPRRVLAVWPEPRERGPRATGASVLSMARPFPAPIPVSIPAPIPAPIPTSFIPALRQGPLPGAAPPPVFRARHWSGSGWAIVRPGGRATPFASQLGGSQAGVRLAYAIDRARRVAIVARAAAALGTRQQEAGIGLDWKPTALPIHLVAEQRIGIAGVRGGQALGAIGGIGPVPIGAGFRLEAYGQAGAIVRGGGVEGFADGQTRATRVIAAIGATTLEAGAGAWAAAQRGASRVDLGPTAGAILPVGKHRLRVAVDWRQRVAGDARPGSGPALSVGTDF